MGESRVDGSFFADVFLYLFASALYQVDFSSATVKLEAENFFGESRCCVVNRRMIYYQAFCPRDVMSLVMKLYLTA